VAEKYPLHLSFFPSGHQGVSMTTTTAFVISGFHGSVNEVFTILGYSAVFIGG
jgi:hypothetical protein